MKTKTLFRTSLFLFCLSITISSNRAQSSRSSRDTFAVVYTEDNYEGWSYRILPGDEISGFSRLDDGRWAFLDREIESIEIYGDMQLELWNRQGFRGDAIIISESIRDLRRARNARGEAFGQQSEQNWNNRIVSIRADFLGPSGPIGEPVHPPAHPRPPGRHINREVVFFSDSSFRGDALIFDQPLLIPRLDEYFMEQDNWNDTISSIEVSGKLVVTLFEHADFKGRSVRIDNSYTDLGQTRDDSNNYANWNDRASSLKIERRSNVPEETMPPIATLFDDSSYKGGNLSLFEGQILRNLSEIDWNDRASSMKVDPEYVVVLYEHADLGGKSIQVSGDQNNFNWLRTKNGRTEGWNDRASSLKVVRK